MKAAQESANEKIMSTVEETVEFSLDTLKMNVRSPDHQGCEASNTSSEQPTADGFNQPLKNGRLK